MELAAYLPETNVTAHVPTLKPVKKNKALVIPIESAVKITIITVAYNSAATIGKTLESVRQQRFVNVEHIIIDGGSTDGTLDIVKSYDHVSCLVSEKDKGIYDAMNKGLALATGDVIGFLNSDDVYAHENILSKVAIQFEQHKVDTVYGDLHYVDAENANKVLRNWVSGDFKKHKFKFGWMPPHPTFFVSKEVYKKVGGFNLSLRCASDYELMLRILYKHQFTTSYLHEVLVKMKVGGASNGSIKKRLVANQEDRLAWRLNDLHPYFFTLYFKPLRKLLQYMNVEQFKRILA